MMGPMDRSRPIQSMGRDAGLRPALRREAAQATTSRGEEKRNERQPSLFRSKELRTIEQGLRPCGLLGPMGPIIIY